MGSTPQTENNTNMSSEGDNITDDPVHGGALAIILIGRYLFGIKGHSWGWIEISGAYFLWLSLTSLIHKSVAPTLIARIRTYPEIARNLLYRSVSVGLTAWIVFEVILLTAVTYRRECSQPEKIAVIGGCDAFGNCGVTFESGRLGRARLPAVGSIACTSYTWEKKDHANLDNFLESIKSFGR